MNRLDYGFTVYIDVDASGDTPFSGQIWMPTGSLMGSTAQVSPWVAKESDFAIPVGDITGGAYGGSRTLVALPNSGVILIMDLLYITDSYGRPLEAGTIPHYFNRDEMDALETVLAIINENL
ncbi:MAG: hypothetical protein FWE34_04850 [Defluviitaleaceae bacterium]|nr:hypothetical protein [Defluviitaleaceae bacterium]